METSPPPRSAIDLMPTLYYQLVYTLMDLLPPPLDDTQAALRARNLTAVAKVAALAPVNADEADIAAHCIASRAQAEEMLRLVRKNDHHPELVVKLNRQYASMMRLWLSVHARLRRVQAERRTRDGNAATENEDAWARYIAERSMLEVVLAQPDAEPAEPVRPQQTPIAGPAAARSASPVKTSVVAPVVDRAAAPSEMISKNEMNAQDVAFETWLSAQAANPDPTASKVDNFRRILLGTTRFFQQETGTDPESNGT